MTITVDHLIEIIVAAVIGCLISVLFINTSF